MRYYTEHDVSRAIIDKVHELGRDIVVRLLARFGVTKGQQLRLKDVNDFMHALSEMKAPATVPASVPVKPKFAVGDRIECVYNGKSGSVASIEIMYNLSMDDGVPKRLSENNLRPISPVVAPKPVYPNGTTVWDHTQLAKGTIKGLLYNVQYTHGGERHVSPDDVMRYC